ncbi:hypothetical protein EOW65_06480 [Sinirhodobacter ferrireducens]|uniref:Uncharacterized protein n=1 Tax=Paenirhodobacter ferrireducens TaxID=1215032 RepID=A0A443LN77_9RHOB|nr:hypothetical protein [Sinirhodobacter ferrireducens]RWR50598.1 hypothetical protein EOW65_06480 [Sinirhodobacter ferrireducens]
MANGVTTVNLTSSSLIDTLVGSYAGSTRKITLTRLVALINSLLGPTYATRAELYADRSWPDGAIGYVRGDPTSAYNGVYTKSGASGSGSWTRTGDLPTSAVEAAQIDTLSNALTALGDDLHTRRVVATAGNNFSAVTWPPGTTTVLQRDGASFRVWRLYTDAVPTPVDATHYQQDATGAWWNKVFDLAEVTAAIAAEAGRAEAAEGVISASLTALGADLHTRRVVATAGNNFSAVTWPEGTTTVLQRDGSSFRVWRLYTDVVPTPVDATHYQQDATGAWWHKAFDLAEVMTAIAAEAERAGAAEGVIAGNLVNEVNRATAAEGVIAGNLSNEVNRATAAEGVIAGNLANEVNRATAAEGVIAGNLANEVNRATAAEGVIAGNLANEVNRATVADARLARAAGGAHSYSEDALDDEAAIRIDFASGEMFIKAVDGDSARDPSEFASVSPMTQLVKNRSGVLRRSVAGALRRSVAADGASGAVFEPQATVWGSDNVLGTGVTVSGITVAADSSVPAVEGTTPKALTATASGTAARFFGYAAIPITVGWYQVDLILARQDARYMIFRLPPEAGSTAFGGSGYVFCIDLQERTFTNTMTSTVADADGPFFDDLPGGLIRIRFRFWAFSAYAAGHFFYVYPKETSNTTLTSTFAAGTALGVIHHFSVQKCASPRLPAAPVGNGVSVAADKMEIDVSNLIQDPLSWSFECHFRLSPGFRETADGIVPIFKVSVDPDTANRGVGLEMVGRAITAVLGSTSVPKTVSIEDVYSDSYRVAMSYDGETLRLAVNGLMASATVNSIANLYTQLKRLRFGDYMPIQDGTLRPFSGAIEFWRYVPRALSQDEMIAATTSPQTIIPGSSVPVLADGTGQPVLSLAGDGSIDFKPGRAAARYLLSGAYWADALPADAMAITPRTNGDVDYLTDTWGGRTHRVRQSAEGWGIFYRADGQVDILWGSGQSLAYGNVYTDPVVSPDTPGFLDVDDGNPSSVFGYSATGYYNDRLTYPWIAAANGGGGNVYPAAKMLANLRAEDDHTPLPLIAKTIGQSGARILSLWPWGVYSTDPWDEDGNWVEGTTVKDPAIFPDTHWLNVRRWHQSVKDACTRLGFTPVVKAFTWVQGTADKTNLHYYDDLVLSRADFRKLTKEFYGEQEHDPLWVLSQSGGDTDTSTIVWPVCDAQLRYCEETPRTVLGAPLYQPDIVLQDGQVHPNYHSTTIFGELLGLATHETLNGRKWTIGTPDITVAADHLILDYSKWLRDDELLTIAADTYYGGIGIDVGKGVQIVDVINTTSSSSSRTGALTPVTGVEVINGGTAYKVSFSGAIQKTQGFQVRYALQQQDMSTADPLHYAHRGLLRTTWERPSFALPDRKLHRWLPSFRKEFLL